MSSNYDSNSAKSISVGHSNPIINNITEDNGILKFTLSNVDVSIANAIRRIILSDINCIVFKTSPYEENNCTIHSNTSRLNNEIVKQRLSCIPIHINDLSFPINDYILEINEKNDSDTIKMITTNDFKIKNIKTNKYLSKSAVNQIFPPDPISTRYIDFIRLRPKLSDDIDGEEINLECKFSISNAKDDSMFNVVSCCAFGNTLDSLLINKTWNEKEKKLKSENHTTEDIEYLKNDWMNLDAQRYFKKNSFDFMIETVGIFDNAVIVKESCSIMINKLDTFLENIKGNKDLIVPIKNTMPKCHEIILEKEDYTLGKVLEGLLYKNYYIQDNGDQPNPNRLIYCGFRKPHPHINISIIRLAFRNTNMSDSIYIDMINDMLVNIVNESKLIFKNIMDSF
jgi:DNA-directed RNA polymerase subunit L